MALTYTYKDTFIMDSVDAADQEEAETDALTDLGKQLVTDVYYLEKMTQCLVYITLGTQQLEAEGMKDKIAEYRKEYARYSRMNTFENVDEGILCGSIERG